MTHCIEPHPDIEWTGAYPVAVEENNSRTIVKDTNSGDGVVEVSYHFSPIFDYDLFNRENPS